MRLFFPLSIVLFFSSLHADSQIPGQGSYELAYTNTSALQPEFIDGMSMDIHSRKTTIRNIVEIKKNAQSVTPETGTAEKKFTVINNQVVLVNNNQVEMVDSNHEALKNLEPITVTEPAPVIAKEQPRTTIITTSEMTTEDMAPPAEEEIIEPVITKYAEMISVDPTEITNYPLYHFIDKWWGVPYKWGGADKKGIDCSAFSQKLYNTVYNMNLERTAREQHRNCERIRHTDEANEGDLIFFRIHRLRISHVGVYLANGYFVHASRSKGVMISSLSSKYWRNRYAGCGRMTREEKPSESDFLQ